MNNLNNFTYHFDPTGDFATMDHMDIRVVDHDGNPWFVARDVATILGYVNTNKTINKFCKRSTSLKELTGVPNRYPLQITTKLIPESDLYRLIMRSDMPEAERFQDWVCEEVLPTIRRTGGTYQELRSNHD